MAAAVTGPPALMVSRDHSEKITVDRVGPSVPELFARATADHEAGRLQQALEVYARILEHDERHAATLLYVADIYLKYDRVADAQLTLEHLLALDSSAFLEGIEGLSQICLDFAQVWGEEQRELSDRLLARVVEVWPNLPEANEAVARRLAEDGDLKGAASYYQHALKLAPERSETWYRLALVRIEARDWAGALEALLEVLDRDPGHTEAVRRAIVAANALEDADHGAHFLHHLIELIEEDGEALAYIGFKLLADRHFDGALAAFARAADLDLGSYETLIGATTAAHALGEGKAARAYWDQAIVAMPNDAEIWLGMARTFGPDLPDRLARQLIDGAATISRQDAEALCEVVLVAHELGQAEASKAIVALALKLDPTNRRARQLDAALTSGRG